MKSFSLLIKPSGADCNLNCAYCFYLGKNRLYPDSPTHRMSLETLDRMIASYMATEQPQYAFGWQGG
ncbi:MAG: anaerobic sulfatase maturase, partial [Lentisphaerae bacterium]|nr:anaerobic sulfatase maturase [Lentisphaerota bacterium]